MCFLNIKNINNNFLFDERKIRVSIKKIFLNDKDYKKSKQDLFIKILIRIATNKYLNKKLISYNIYKESLIKYENSTYVFNNFVIKWIVNYYINAYMSIKLLSYNIYKEYYVKYHHFILTYKFIIIIKINSYKINTYIYFILLSYNLYKNYYIDYMNYIYHLKNLYNIYHINEYFFNINKELKSYKKIKK